MGKLYLAETRVRLMPPNPALGHNVRVNGNGLGDADDCADFDNGT